MMLPMGVEELVRELGETALIREDDELLELQVRTPSLHSQQDGHELLFVG